MGLQAAASAVIKSVPAVRVLAFRSVGENYAAQKDMWPVVLAAAHSVGVVAAGPTFTTYYDQGFKESDVDMEVCVPIDNAADIPADKLPEGVRIMERASAPRVATMIHVGSHASIVETYAKLFPWIASEKLRPASPVREVFLKMEPGSPNAADNVTEIQQIIA